jgi:hypothetical protein
VKYLCTDQAEAQAICDRAHEYMIAKDKGYADSAAKNHTQRWSVPQRDTDEDGKPIGPWFVILDERVLDEFKDEAEKLDDDAKAVLTAREINER